MGLSCSCDSDGEWWHSPADDYQTLSTKRSRKCASCRERITVGATVLRLDCWHYPNSDIEERIYGDEVPMSPRWLCERCADLYLSITELGYCVNCGDDMRELVREYAAMQETERGHRVARASAPAASAETADA